MDLNKLKELKEEVNAIMIDGPSGTPIKKAIIKLIDILVEDGRNKVDQWPKLPTLADYVDIDTLEDES